MTTSISIHALREEGDGSTTSTSGAFTIFLSTPSARRATFVRQMSWHDAKFLSTPSARRATDGLAQLIPDGLFLSTPSARRAT